MKLKINIKELYGVYQRFLRFDDVECTLLVGSLYQPYENINVKRWDDEFIYLEENLTKETIIQMLVDDFGRVLLDRINIITETLQENNYNLKNVDDIHYYIELIQLYNTKLYKFSFKARNIIVEIEDGKK